MALTALLFFLGAQAVSYPEDAKDFLSYLAEESNSSAQTAYVLLISGAGNQLRNYVLTSGNNVNDVISDSTADMSRFFLQAGCWSPNLYSETMGLSQRWLEVHSQSQPVEVVSQVQSISEFLKEKEQLKKESLASVYKAVLSLLFFMFLCLVAWRRVN